MSNLINLLPRDKHDFERVNELKKLDKNDLKELIPELLEWLQDINWPIAIEISRLLLTIPQETIPFVINVLNGRDDIWKEWCLRYFVMELPKEIRKILQGHIERIAYNPTKGEELEEVHLTAQEILNKGR
ncbi:hypothetical protein J40TS1_31670 [Paenibacillus montaniterrae]|uniref:DUF5071 domain-containing protein n=1 Tax=Paenibacillus montaniterrae TaxID=429341 RepID=A0A920CYL1_9BACL|nr:DUF5071 domain-containing protein [Paenibacillus montaniterrae]GIP17525.1 hypothetical protein J40TS1_31670 [Paenibacillus montaniterrae]